MTRYKRIAVYPSVLYGTDFIVESLQSILPHVDRAFVVMMKRPWGNTSGVSYRGHWIPWPQKFDDTPEKAVSLNTSFEAKVVVVEAEKDSPWNRWGFGVNDVVRDRLGVTTDEVVILDPDCVFHEVEAARAFADWEVHPEYEWAHVEQIELWRTPAWQVRRPRAMASLHRGDLDQLSSDRRGFKAAPVSRKLAGRIHNFGFAVCETSMRWKHLCSLAFSPVVGESLPHPDWYEEKWLRWDPVTNNRDLEPATGLQQTIPCATPYDILGLPCAIKRRYDAGEWPLYQGR